MATGAHFGYPKITFGRISGHFRSIRNFFLIFFTKWLPSAILDGRNSLWITFLAILDQYRFYFLFFYKMAASGHFGCSKITFDLISAHFRSIRNFIFFWKFLTKWLPSAILDFRNSLWITFLAILDQCRFFIFFTKWLPVAILDVRKSLSISFLSISHRYATFFLLKFLTMADVGHFWMSEFHFRSHFWPFQICNFNCFEFVWQKGCRRPFWMPENHFRSHFYPFHIDTQHYFFLKFLTKWPFHFRSHFWPFQIDTQL